MRLVLFYLSLLLLTLGGCYDGQALVARISQRVADDQRAEIDLGVYQVTLPRGPSEPVATTIKLEVVATVHRQNASQIKRQLHAVRTHLRHATILALRQSPPEDLLEPRLTKLHERIEGATEEHLTAAPIESIAFRSFAVFED
jgi:hypothetical protein